MSISYKNNHKPCFAKRIWNRVFHKGNLLPSPIKYTQKEVKLKMQEILSFFRYRNRFEK